MGIWAYSGKHTKNKRWKVCYENSTVGFLVLTKDAGEDGIEVRVQNHDVWLT